jgi:hypothetical protein
MSKLFKYCIICAIFIFIQCKKIYNPEIDKPAKVLVVEALITDEPVAQLIKLSNAVPYDTSYFLPEGGASVVVVDQASQYTFVQTRSGYYYSDPQKFKPTSGKSYRLSITTGDKRKYISDFQVMPAKASIDTIYANIQSKTFSRLIDNQYTFLDFQGFQLYGKLKSSNSQFLRFSSSVLIEYYYIDAIDSTHYCWRKQNMDDFFNIVDTKYNTSASHEQQLCFLPYDKTYYGIYDELDSNLNTLYTHIISFVLTIKQYQLSQNVYNFYQNVNEQLKAQNRIFDPNTKQFKGNIICQNDPEKFVFGIFEVSSVKINSLVIDAYAGSNRVRMRKINAFDVDKAPAANCVMNTAPNFFIR